MISDYAKGYQDGKVAQMQRVELSEEQKVLVRELIELVMYLARSDIPPEGIIVEPISTNVDRVKHLKQKLGLGE